jgi:hypothetical protein
MAMNLQQMLSQMGAGGMTGGGVDIPVVDTAETVYISSLALLKMLKHGTFVQILNICSYNVFCKLSIIWRFIRSNFDGCKDSFAS